MSEKQWLPSPGQMFEYGTHRSYAKCIAVGEEYIFASRGVLFSDDYEEWLIDKLTQFAPTNEHRESVIGEMIREFGMSRVTAGDMYDVGYRKG